MVGEVGVAAELGSVGLMSLWPDLSGGGKTEPDILGLGPETAPPRDSSISSIDLWAACCLAALD